MKKIILLILGIFFGLIISLNAQSLAGYKIFINPGHGGHDSDDREIPLAPGITYWESEGNLSKGLYLRTMLESLGATVIMSRVTNTTADDIPVSQMAAIANSYNVDYFHAIHSNATGTSTKANYTLILFQGRTSVPTYAGSLVMANFLVNEINKADRTISKMVAGDSDFYGTGQPYLGVFKWLNMPGTLSEGSFHDYTPETWRLKNESYLKHEAWGIARAFLQYFKGGNFPKGIAAGILRDELESVPASYSPLSGTKDNFKPVNGAKVTLIPGGRTYTTDNFNNGYYFFDEVVPGNYKLIFEYDKMKTDTLAVTVKANESVFTDKAMILNPILDPPAIVNSSPADNLTEVSNITNIVMEFSIRMNTDVTQNAVSILPSVAGSYKWDTNYKILTFTPAKGYMPGTKYTVTISTSAKTYFGVNLQQPRSFSFTTRSKLNLISTYPVSGAADISTTVLMRLQFEKGIDASTMANKITVTDSTGVPILLQANISRYSQGIIDFEPKIPLSNNTTYSITVKEGIGDVEYVLFPKTVTIQYKTEKKYTFVGDIIEGFETENIWQSPLLSPNTKDVNTSTTSFVIYNLRKKSGDNSGKLNYGFSGTTGLIEIALINPIDLAQSSTAGFGMWVYGDNSKNILEYRFLRAGTTYEKVKIDTLNWTGWKLKRILLTDIPGSGKIQFKSITIVQSGNGSTGGTLYFDECISNIITGVEQNNNLPVVYKLEQNYPNPFNPSTAISYQLSSISRVTLKVYDMLGREVATLVNEDKEPGKHVVNFYAEGLASGIYIYRIQAGNFVASKKLILLK
jgi:N-acetylmuramoyl-L-alanine amidase